MKEASVDGFASQVVIKGNVFVNFNSPAIDVHGVGQSVDTPPENIIITANSMDLTVIGEPRDVKIGDEFLIYGHKALPWLIHHNIIDNCTVPMYLDTFGGERAVLDKNIY